MTPSTMSENIDPRGRGAAINARRRLRLVAAGAFVIIAGCASVTAPHIEPPQVTLESVRVTRIVDGRAELSVALKLSNPNASPLAVRAVDYEVTLDNRPAASGHTVRIETLPAGGETKVELAGRVDVGAIATAMMALGSQLPVAYTLTGTVTVQNWAPVSFSRSGKIAVSKFDSAFGTSPR
jgi:LEA14-like dessication related protein